MNAQSIFVNEAGSNEALGELSAAVCKDEIARRLLQSENFLCEIARTIGVRLDNFFNAKGERMHSTRMVWLIAVVVLLSGCAPMINTKPMEVYADKDHPKSDTAIFSCMPIGQFICNIKRVDDVDTIPAMWVRVLPGPHVIWPQVQDGERIGTSPVHVANALPSHVYEVRMMDLGKTYKLWFEDLGKKDSYSKRVGLEHFNATNFTVGF